MTTTETRTEQGRAQDDRVATPDFAKRRLMRRRLATLMVAVGIVALWDGAVRFGGVGEIIVPYPADVVGALGELVVDGGFWRHTWITTYETLVGFAIGAAVGFVGGALLGMSSWTRAVLFPYVIAFQGLPKVVLAPVFITALGFGTSSKIAMAAALAFFPVLLNTMVGILGVDPDEARLLRSYHATSWQTFRKLTLPSATPLVFAGLKASLTFALIGAIVGEFVGASSGLGYLLNAYAYRLQVPEVWAVMIVLALLGMILYAIIELIDKRVVHWRTEQHPDAGM